MRSEGECRNNLKSIWSDGLFGRGHPIHSFPALIVVFEEIPEQPEAPCGTKQVVRWRGFLIL
jgi:hypothetical protein